MSRRVLGAILLALLLAVSRPVAQAPSLESVLARAGEYVTGYILANPLLIAEESYLQILRPYGSTRNDVLASGAMLGEMGTPQVRKIRSEFALLAIPEAHAWMAFRDVREVDGKPVRDGQDRLEGVFTGASATPLADARALTDAALKYNLGRTVRDVNVPTFPLMILLPSNQDRFVFSKKGEKREDRTPVWVIEYTETSRPPLATTADGIPKPARGELWLDPTDGRVVRTHLVFDTLDAIPDMKMRPERYADFPRATIDVTYGKEPALDAWVPVEAQENYTRRDEVVTCTITYSHFRRFELTPKRSPGSVGTGSGRPPVRAGHRTRPPGTGELVTSGRRPVRDR